jgi:hypothetical protein
MSDDEQRPFSITHIFEDDFASVDASISVYHSALVRGEPFAFTRTVTTLGSITYVMQAGNSEELWTILLIKLDWNRLKLWITVPQKITVNSEALLPHHILNGLMSHRDIQRTEPLSPPITFEDGVTFEDGAANISDLIRITNKKGGRPKSNDNTWIREQVALGANRSEVFATYLQRQHINLEDKAAVDRARARFKQALRRSKGTK